MGSLTERIAVEAEFKGQRVEFLEELVNPAVDRMDDAF
jgi:hypothetical protein